jgi:hypothetical protein
MWERSWSFPSDEVSDEELVRRLGLAQPYPGVVDFKAPQLLATDFAASHPKFILSFQKGMGKTLTYFTAAQQIGSPEHNLLLCSKAAMLRQKQEIDKFFPDLADEVVFVKGTTPSQRKPQWETKARYHVGTFAAFLTDAGRRVKSRSDVTAGRSSAILPGWAYRPKMLIGDEYHKVLRNKGSATHHLFRELTPEHIILSSGSAANKGAHSMWTALNVLDPIKYSSFWKYVNTYCIVEHNHFGKVISGVRNRAEWRNHVAPNVFHRLKDLKDYPPKTRQALPVQMENWQKKIHDELKENLLTILPSDAILTAPNTLAATTKIRQLLICPKFLDPDLGWGAGLEGILDDVQESELTHFVVSTFYTGPIPLIEQFFRMHKFPAYHLQGGMDMDEMEAMIRKWQETGGVMVQSIMFAESYELPPATNMYMLGYAHDPEQNSQAEDRIHRDRRVTPHPVNIYYVKNLGAYDERIIEAMSGYADDIDYMMNQPIKELFT